MTKRVVLLLAGLMLLTACESQNKQSPTATVVTSNHRLLIQQAETAYLEGDFAEALEAAQAAIQAAPQDATAWEWVRRSSVAKAADDYLSDLPPDRYRLSPAAFIEDVVNGKLYTILDVREPDEFAEGHIERAVNIPLRELTQRLGDLPGNASNPMVVYCHSGRRATHALVILRELGYRQVYNLDGGYEAYLEFLNTHPMPTPGPTPTFDPARNPDQDGGC